MRNNFILSSYCELRNCIASGETFETVQMWVNKWDFKKESWTYSIIDVDIKLQIFKELWWEITEFLLRLHIYMSPYIYYLVVLVKLYKCRCTKVFFFLIWFKSYNLLSTESHCCLWETIEKFKRFLFLHKMYGDYVFQGFCYLGHRKYNRGSIYLYI